jgi:hypothetical protein
MFSWMITRKRSRSLARFLGWIIRLGYLVCTALQAMSVIHAAGVGSVLAWMDGTPASCIIGMLLVEAFYSHEYTPCIFTLDLCSIPSFPCCRKGYGSVLPERDTHVNHLASNEWLAVRQYSATSTA